MEIEGPSCHTSKAMDGRPRCLIVVVVVVVCSYVLAILSAVHFAGATYLLTYGFVEIYFIAELALVIFSVRRSNPSAMYSSLAKF